MTETIETVPGSLYDFPRYYDLVFGSDWKAEYDFLQHCFAHHAKRKVKSVFEPACGTGRLMYRLAKGGYEVRGLDLNRRAVKYCNDRLERHGFPRSAWEGDMSDFRMTPRADAGFNMINSFRHLEAERQARSHLQCMAQAIRVGGLYVIGLHLTPLTGEPLEEESWAAQRGHLCVATRLWTLQREPRRRLERFCMTCDVHTPRRSFRLIDEISFRTYTASQFGRLLQSVPEWEVAETYDFSYEPDEPIEIWPETEDVVYVLRRRRAS